MSTGFFSSTLHIVVSLFVLTTNEVVGINRGDGKKYEKSHSHILLTVLRTVSDLLTRLGAVEGPVLHLLAQLIKHVHLNTVNIPVLKFIGNLMCNLFLDRLIFINSSIARLIMFVKQ